MIKMEECLRPHQLLHMLMGIGIGLALAGVSQVIYGWALTLGVIFVCIAFVGEWIWNK